MVEKKSGMSIFERYLTLWVGLCIVLGIMLGKVAPGVAKSLDGMALSVNGAPVVSIPIAICLFFMMYPIMVKIDFTEVLMAGKNIKPVGLTLLVNWAIKPFTMYALSLGFLGFLFARCTKLSVRKNLQAFQRNWLLAGLTEAQLALLEQELALFYGLSVFVSKDQGNPVHWI